MRTVFLTTTNRRGQKWLKEQLEEFKLVFASVPEDQKHLWIQTSCCNHFTLQNGDTYQYCTKEVECCGVTIDTLLVDDGVAIDCDVLKEFRIHTAGYMESEKDRRAKELRLHKKKSLKEVQFLCKATANTMFGVGDREWNLMLEFANKIDKHIERYYKEVV